MSPQVAYLLARIAEDEAEACEAQAKGEQGYHLPDWPIAAKTDRDYLDAFVAVHPARVLAECKAKRKTLELHESWPVLVEGPPILAHDLQSTLASITQQIVFMTEREYRNRFGDDPPTSPIIRAMLQPYADRDDFDPTWKD